MKKKHSGWSNHLLIPLCIIGFIVTLSPLSYFVTRQLTLLLDKTSIAPLLTYYIIPLEIQVLRFLLHLLGIATTAINDHKTILLHRADSTALSLQITWGCIGWESLLCLIISLLAGLHRRYTLVSRFLTITLGILGTIMINLLRLLLVALLGFFFGNRVSIAYHNYFSAALVLLWLLLYWWICYGYLLREKYDPTRDMYLAEDDK